MKTVYEYKVLDVYGKTYTLVTSNDPNEYPDLVDVVTLGEYNPTTQKDWVLA